MARRIPQRETIIDSTGTSVHAGIRVSDYRNCILQIQGSASANMKIFVKGAVGDTRPDFTVNSGERSANNAWWDYVEVVDLEDGAAIDGDTGVNLSGNVVRLIEVNINSLDWLSVHSTAVVGGATSTVTCVGVFTTNE